VVLISVNQNLIGQQIQNYLPGSSIKPFIYACAFENGLNPSSIFIDGPIIFDDDKLESIWRPRNNSGQFYGPIRLRESLIQSLNIVSIKLVQSSRFV